MIHIVIPVHDRVSLTRRCLLALRAQTCGDFRIVVVDDGSRDGTDRMLRDEFPEVDVLRGDGHLWWTGAVNLACAHILQRAGIGDLVVLLNDDTEPLPGWLDALAAAAELRPGALIGSLNVARGPGTVMNATVSVDWRTARFRWPFRGLPPEDLPQAPDGLLRSDLLSGRGTLISVDALRRLGPLRRDLPQYGADYEFSARAARRGHELLVCLDAMLECDAEATGLHGRPADGLAALVRRFWSIRSAYSLRYRYRFAVATCPRAALPSYLLLDTARVLLGRLRAAERRP